AVLLWVAGCFVIGRRVLGWIARGFLIVVLAVLTMIDIVVFGHYAYLVVWLFACVMRYLEVALFSRDLLLLSYPLFW
ncbi:sulfatase, partial [Pseudomonas syringae pv. tagetis]